MALIRSIALAGAVVAATSVGASAATIVSATVVGYPTLSNVPFTLDLIGSGGPAGQVTAPAVASGFTTPGGYTITYSGLSGVYVGDVANITRSPIRQTLTLPTDQWYYNARANSGNVTVSMPFATNTFQMLWGSVDPNSPVNWNLLTIQLIGPSGTDTITGQDIINAATGETPSTSDIAVTFTTARQFNQLVFTATQNAFEFMLAMPVNVPEPASLALLGAGLLGLGFAARRRRSG